MWYTRCHRGLLRRFFGSLGPVQFRLGRDCFFEARLVLCRGKVSGLSARVVLSPFPATSTSLSWSFFERGGRYISVRWFAGRSFGLSHGSR